MTPFEIPLSAKPQTFGILLGGIQYQMTVHWCNPAQCWIVDIADSLGNDLVNGLPMITGADLLEQFAYLGIGGELVAQTTNNPDTVPTFDNLGTLGKFYFITP